MATPGRWRRRVRPVLVVGAAGKTGRAVAARARRPRGAGAGRRADGARGRGARRARRPVAVDLVTGAGPGGRRSTARAAAYHLAPERAPRRGRHRRAGGGRRDGRRAAAARLPLGARTPATHGCRTTCARPRRRRCCATALGERLTVLRPAAYHQNLVGQARPGCCAVPYSLDAPFTNVDLADVAEVAADALDRRATPGRPRPRRARGADDPGAGRAGRGRALGRPVATVRRTCGEWLDGPGAASAGRPATTSPPCSRPTTRAASSGDVAVLAAALGRPADDVGPVRVPFRVSRLTQARRVIARASPGPGGRIRA